MNKCVIRKVLTIVAGILLCGCGPSFDIYSPDQIHRTVRVLGPGHYVVSYKWRYVEENFGKDRATAIPAYLKAKGIVPPDCSRGITVIRGGETEGGGGWTEFRCNQN